MKSKQNLMRESFALHVRKNNLTEEQIIEVLKNRTVIILNDKRRHNYGRPGSVIVFDNPDMIIITEDRYIKHGKKGKNFIKFDQFSLVASAEEIKSQIIKLQNEIVYLKRKLKNL